MIISNTHQFIFIKTKKTAGTSFEIALSKYMSPDDIITPISRYDEELRNKLGYNGPQNYLYSLPRFANHLFPNGFRKYKNHTQARLIRSRLGDVKFKSFLKVSIVRNPFDLAVSRFYWAHRNSSRISIDDFKSWLIKRPNTLLSNRHITHIGGKCAVDVMLRFEHFDKDIPMFAQMVGLPDTFYDEFISLRAKSFHRPRGATVQSIFQDFPKGVDVINSLFKEEIDIYNYSYK